MELCKYFNQELDMGEIFRDNQFSLKWKDSEWFIVDYLDDFEPICFLVI